MCRTLSFFTIFLFAASCLSADSTYFYKNIGIGSDAMFNPVSSVLNGGYYVLQAKNRSNRMDDLNYSMAINNVFHNLSHPLENIRIIGWKGFIGTEVLPLSFDLNSAQYVPNIQLHLIGCGSTYRAMWEWYGVHGFKHNKLWAFTTTIATRILNETVENGNYTGPSVDAIADVYIFDPLGMLLFEWNRAAKFFSSTLNLSDWSYQIMINPLNATIENAGVNWSLKYFPRQAGWGLFACTGMNSTGGFSYRNASKQCVSGGVGLSVENVVNVDEPPGSVRVQTVTMRWNVAFYYDRENSLLMSLILSGNRQYRLQYNLYPGYVFWKGLKPSLFLGLRDNYYPVIGISFSGFPLGLAL